MNHHNYLFTPNVTVGGLVGFSCQGDTTKPPFHYQDMSVREQRSPCSAYLSQSNENQNNAYPINPLNEFRIAPVMQTVPDSFDEFNLAFTSESSPDEYKPWNPDTESIEDELFPLLGSYLCDQPLFSEYEPDLSEPTPSNHLNLNHHSTNLPANLACPQNSQPVAVAYPLNLQQVTNDNPANSAEIVVDECTQVEHKKNRCKESSCSESGNAKKRLRYKKDHVFAEGQRVYARTYYRMKKLFTREVTVKLATAAKVKYFRSVRYPADSGDLRQTPYSGETTQNAIENSHILPFSSGNERDIRELIPANCLSLNHHLTILPDELTYLQDSRPVAVANPLNLQQDTTKSSVYSAEIVAGRSLQAEHQMEEKSTYYQNNPAYPEGRRQFQKECRINPAILKRVMDQKNKRCQNALIHLESQKLYNNTYNKVKRKFGKEEASRQASITRAEFLQLVNALNRI